MAERIVHIFKIVNVNDQHSMACIRAFFQVASYFCSCSSPVVQPCQGIPFHLLRKAAGLFLLFIDIQHPAHHPDDFSIHPRYALVIETIPLVLFFWCIAADLNTKLHSRIPLLAGSLLHSAPELINILLMKNPIHLRPLGKMLQSVSHTAKLQIFPGNKHFPALHVQIKGKLSCQ